MSSSKRSSCVICSEKSVELDMERNDSFDKMGSLIFQTIMKLDIKPKIYMKFDYCSDCFKCIVDIADTNIFCHYLEMHLKNLKEKLFEKTEKGIDKLKDNKDNFQELHRKYSELKKSPKKGMTEEVNIERKKYNVTISSSSAERNGSSKKDDGDFINIDDSEDERDFKPTKKRKGKSRETRARKVKRTSNNEESEEPSLTDKSDTESD